MSYSTFVAIFGFTLSLNTSRHIGQVTSAISLESLRMQQQLSGVLRL